MTSSLLSMRSFASSSTSNPSYCVWLIIVDRTAFPLLVPLPLPRLLLLAPNSAGGDSKPGDDEPACSTTATERRRQRRSEGRFDSCS